MNWTKIYARYIAGGKKERPEVSVDWDEAYRNKKVMGVYKLAIKFSW